MADEKNDKLAPPISIRLTTDMVARIDRLVEDTQAVSPAGADVTRGSIVKVAIDTGVEWLEKQARTLKLIREANRSDGAQAATAPVVEKPEVPSPRETKGARSETKGGKS